MAKTRHAITVAFAVFFHLSPPAGAAGPPPLSVFCVKPELLAMLKKMPIKESCFKPTAGKFCTDPACDNGFHVGKLDADEKKDQVFKLARSDAPGWLLVARLSSNPDPVKVGDFGPAEKNAYFDIQPSSTYGWQGSGDAVLIGHGDQADAFVYMKTEKKFFKVSSTPITPEMRAAASTPPAPAGAPGSKAPRPAAKISKLNRSGPDEDILGIEPFVGYGLDILNQGASGSGAIVFGLMMGLRVYFFPVDWLYLGVDGLLSLPGLPTTNGTTVSGALDIRASLLGGVRFPHSPLRAYLGIGALSYMSWKETPPTGSAQTITMGNLLEGFKLGGSYTFFHLVALNGEFELSTYPGPGSSVTSNLFISSQGIMQMSFALLASVPIYL